MFKNTHTFLVLTGDAKIDDLHHSASFTVGVLLRACRGATGALDPLNSDSLDEGVLILRKVFE
jgi:hypothetical protein